MSPDEPVRVRAWLIGFGTVGQWIAEALLRGRGALARDHGLELVVIGLATARDGFVHDPDGLDLGAALALRRAGRRLRELPGASHFPEPLAGMQATEADVLVEVGLSPPNDGEPGRSHMREALTRGVAVATSNKWPVALAGTELAELGRLTGAAFCAESTVMSGTPVLRALTDGLAGARPKAIRGLLNATTNFILTRMSAGTSYEAALEEAKRLGLAEPDPSSDVDGHDTAAKLMILAGLVLNTRVAADQVRRVGISSLDPEQVARARSQGRAVREVASLAPASGQGSPGLEARIEPSALGPDDPLASVDGTTNAIICDVDPLERIMISGPGAGPALAGQGAFSDLIAIGRELARGRSRASRLE